MSEFENNIDQISNIINHCVNFEHINNNLPNDNLSNDNLSNDNLPNDNLPNDNLPNDNLANIDPFDYELANNKIIHKIKNEELGTRMKRYEAKLNSKILPSESFIIRLDGRSFSKFTKKFNKPFDIVFIKSMCKTMMDLVEEFHPQTGYMHSDEITLIFDSKYSNEEYNKMLKLYKNCKNKIKIHMFNGRIQKILSLISSFCSIRFNYHLNNIIEPIADKYDKSFIMLVKSYKQIFDARILIFNETDKHEILNHQIWRSIYDCERNSISTYAHTYFGTKKIMNKTCLDMIEMLKEKNIDWIKDIPMFIKHGIYCKKILVEKEFNGKKILKNELVCKQLKIHFSNENLKIILDKYWNDSNDKLNIDDLMI